jgi:Nucleotidyl transferase AbiEii toxin, Type IV TA system
MASSPLLAVGENIDEQIERFCASNERVTIPEVIRDIARIACIVNLVRNGMLDGRNTVLCGGMAMRCLESPRLSIWDGDASSRQAPDAETLRTALSYVDEDIAIKPGPTRGWKRGRQLITAQPINYTAYFTALDPGQAEFSLSVSHRGVERPPIRRALHAGYPFPVLADPIEVPLMNPDEMLAEKLVAWWLYGHAKHYNDIAFLAARMAAEDRRDRDPKTRKRLRKLIEVKLDRNRELDERIAFERRPADPARATHPPGGARRARGPSQRQGL